MTQRVSRAAPSGKSQAEDEVVSNLTTQRNAIRMLHERIVVLLQYVTAVVNSQCRDIFCPSSS